jgi:hypothetical protein
VFNPDPAPRDLGLASFGGVLFNDPLPGSDTSTLNYLMIWSALAGPGQYSIDIYSTLAPSFTGFAPTIAVDFNPAIAQTPIPGALPLFASGLGIIGLLHWRRRKEGAQEQARLAEVN